MKKVKLEFCEKQISVEKAWEGMPSKGKDVSKSSMVKYWDKIKPGEAMSSVHESGSLFSQIKIDPKQPSPTMTSKEYQLWHWETPNLLSIKQCFRLQTFPDDYDCEDKIKRYICGMSVPPFMMQRIARQIAIQIFDIGSDEE